MTEAEWMIAGVPDLLTYAATLPRRGRFGFTVERGRTHLLLNCAVARLYWDKLVPKLRAAIKLLEDSTDDRSRRPTDSLPVDPSYLESRIVDSIRDSGDWPARQTSMADLWTLFIGTWTDMTHPERPVPKVMPTYNGWAEYLHDIFGNPFRPVSINSACLTPTVTGLAHTAYEARALPSGTLDLDRLGVLSDALEEAGCENPDILNHLRGPGPHVRGCWVVDLLLGKE